MPEINNTNRAIFDALSLAQREQLYESASQLFSPHKRQLFDKLVLNRTRHICVVLEDIFQPHNASAVLRSCDCFGVKHPDILQTYDHLRQKGYRIIATLPHENDTLITQLDISQPTALVFGTELTGLSQEAIDHADGYVKVPMYGFTESFNISVCAALSLFYLTERMRANPSIHWQLSPLEQITLKLYWSMQVIHDGRNVIDHLMQNQ